MLNPNPPVTIKILNKSIYLTKAALETVRCEELQLELKSAYKSKSKSSHMQTASSASTAYSSMMTPSSTLGHSSKYTTAASTGMSSMMANNTNAGLTSALSTSHHHHPTSLSTKAESSSVTWAPTPQDSHMHDKSSEIDRIMAKIEQARLSIANVCVLSKKITKKLKK